MWEELYKCVQVFWIVEGFEKKSLMLKIIDSVESEFVLPKQCR